ncbi:MAG TPA: phosphatase PAP2 family protein, partial [Steroidobacteraceae bacterium]|nr:phosphatase PAP2 family protein [Steroidobacteraceae bacterium]
TLQVFALDPVIARAWYFDVQTMHWLGTGPGEWWAHSLLHTGGRWLVRTVAALAIAVWALSFFQERARHWRRPAVFVTLAMVLSIAIVGGLKAITNVDCPWDLTGFGGHNPYVELFADRPDALSRARCFPGAHASSGFALVCFYFVLRDRSTALARSGLAIGTGIGIIFSIGQESRGAHFMSHDLVSAAIVWSVQLALYCWLLRPPAENRVPATVQGGRDFRHRASPHLKAGVGLPSYPPRRPPPPPPRIRSAGSAHHRRWPSPCRQSWLP